MKEKFSNFLWATGLLNKKGIIPVLYGSLGLYHIIKPLGPIGDIDFLVNEIWINDKWLELRDYLESNGFTLVDEHEHEFIHPKIDGSVAFGSIEESKKHSGLELRDAQIISQNDSRYYALTAEQYLAAYKACLIDDYRHSKKGEADKQKIAALENYLNKR